MTEVEMLRLANVGHVRMIADLAAERDQLKQRLAEAHDAMNTLTERAGVLISERDEAREERDEVRGERDVLLWQIPNY